MSGTSRWGSLLSGAVAGLESKLDTILADGETQKAEEAARNAKPGVAPKQATSALKTEQQNASRASSKSRANDRLNERLAKAVGKSAEGSWSGRTSLDIPSRTASPALPRTSTDSRNSEAQQEPSVTGAIPADVPEVEIRESQDGVVISTDKASEASPSILSTLGIPNDSSASPSQHSTRPSLD
jgi:hypothetical protein